ncbi:MAG: septal ring lytic transglycosylase RlpA family protein, partial [Mariprofundaceae bacterium]|nr:septal ring lytic transglycosylase RlpA family protein [Mariprofundaceae bacterium]
MYKSWGVKIFSVVLIALLLSSCAPHRRPTPHIPVQHKAYATPAPTQPVKTGSPYQVGGVWYYPLASGEHYDRTGMASWYGKKFHGKKTANGERYDMYAMTAAHTTLPMPSRVRVTNLSNGRSVVVRINDRGPFVKDRVIDLSYAAAKALGYA